MIALFHETQGVIGHSKIVRGSLSMTKKKLQEAIVESFWRTKLLNSDSTYDPAFE